MPATSPAATVSISSGSSVSSHKIGSPDSSGVAAARTNSQRGVITAVPKAVSLGLIRCTRKSLILFHGGRVTRAFPWDILPTLLTHIPVLLQHLPVWKYFENEYRTEYRPVY